MPLPTSEVVVRDGMVHYQGMVFPLNKAKPSPDGMWHGCVVRNGGTWPTSEPYIRCMWYPFSGA